MLAFDLGAPVGDVAWAPFSSTLFAAATEDGRVVAYDLAASSSEPVCEQATVQHAQLTRLAFNPRLPMLLVGDDKCAWLMALFVAPAFGQPSWGLGPTASDSGPLRPLAPQCARMCHAPRR